MAKPKVPRDQAMTDEVRSFLEDLQVKADDTASTAALQATTISGAGLATGGGDLSADRTITVTAAVQADQETGTSTATAVVPGVQHFHKSAAKFWGFVTVSASTPTLESGSHNITSITDGGNGLLTVTIATDFSSANFSAFVMSANPTTGSYAAFESSTAARAAGSISFGNVQSSVGFFDPVNWSFGGFGDQ